MVPLNSQFVCGLISNILTELLDLTWLIWTLRKCVVDSHIYSPNYWLQHGWFGLSGSAWFRFKSTHQIADSGTIDLDSQRVRGWLSNLLTKLLTPTWLTRTLRKCAILSRIYSPNCWLWHGCFGPSGCMWLTLKSTYRIDLDIVDLESQAVRGWPSNLVLTELLTQHDWFGLSDCRWSNLESTHRIADSNMVDLVSQDVRCFVSNLVTELLTPTWLIGLSAGAWLNRESTDWITDPDMIGLDSQIVRGRILNLPIKLLTLTWLIWTLSKCAVSSEIYWPDCWPWHGWYGLSGSA